MDERETSSRTTEPEVTVALVKVADLEKITDHVETLYICAALAGIGLFLVHRWLVDLEVRIDSLDEALLKMMAKS